MARDCIQNKTRIMAPAKANEFLDASESEDEQLGGYDSENEITKGGRGAKRRKIEEVDDEASDFDDDNDSDAEADQEGVAPEDEASEDEEEDGEDKPKSKKSKSDAIANANRPLTKKNLVATDAAIKKSGVVYISRVPPFMKPNKLRSLLVPYGAINRIFLAPEDPVARARRLKGGGNKRKTFTEGWVEFIKKKDAKRVSELLNARPIGGKKSNYYHDDIWNLLYLKGFKWHNLTEQIAAEDAERSSRMRAEIGKTTRENKLFLQNVERAKMLDGMEAKAQAKKRKADEPPAPQGATEDSRKSARTFRQISQVNKGDALAQQPEHVASVLSKIF